MDLHELEAAYAKWLHVGQDPLLVRTLYALIIANRFDSEPVWTLLIAPSGSGKTALLGSLAGSDTTVSVSTLTPNALASGYGDGSESLLFQLDQRVLIVEDMSSVTELTADARSQLFSFLRSAYNGEFTRATGRGQIEWRGKFGMIGGATLAIESGRRMEASLGERFLTLRPRVNWDDQNILLDRVMQGSTHKSAMKDELKQVAAAYLANTFDTTSRKVRATSVDLYKKVAVQLARLRTTAARDGFTREISFPLEVGEMGTRLFTQFLVVGLAAHAMGCTWDEVDAMVLRLMMDSIPYTRAKILRHVHRGQNEIRTLQPAMAMSQAVVGRHLEEMKLLGIITLSKTRKFEIADDTVRLALDQDP
jgi:hypothetical protein